MVYHEIRKENGKKKNYLVVNERKNKKWSKKSKFIGYGNIPTEKIEEEKAKFKIEHIIEKKAVFMNEQQIRKVEELKSNYLNKIKSLHEEEFNKFEESFFTELTYNSNAIEGSSLSLEDTRLIIEEKLVPEGKTLREIHEAKNHIEAIKFIKKYNGQFNEIFLLQLHKTILKDISERFAGRYRENPIKIFGGDAKFPDAEKIPQLVKNLFYWYAKNKKKMHPFEMAIIFSMKLVTIHPFIDGNGRVSRLIMNYLLNKKNYPWINIYIKQRAEYLRAVRKANDENYVFILPFCIKTLEDNLKSFGI